MELTKSASFKLILFEPTHTDDESEDHDYSEQETDEE
jgi:hypothetical protein